MAVDRIPSTLDLGIALFCFVHFLAPCLAQVNPSIGIGEPNVEAADCPNLTIFPKLVTSTVVSCRSGDSVEVTMPLKPDAQGFAREKAVRGAYEYREYQITLHDQQQGDPQERIFENLMQLLTMTGFIVKYSYSPITITARNGGVWILINVSEDFYNVSVVRAKEGPWAPPFKSAEEISREMGLERRAVIYGIEFFPSNQAINEKNCKALTEVLQYLRNNPDQAVTVESHKFSTRGSAEDDLEITRRRANAVVDWLVAHGITAGRLQAKPFGRAKPVTENDTPQEIQQNERIELALLPGTAR